MRVGLENLAVDTQYERRDGQAVEQLAVERPVLVEGVEQVPGLRCRADFRAGLAQQQDEVVARPARHARLEHHALERRGPGRREVRPRYPVEQYLLEDPLDVRPLGGREGDPESLADRVFGREAGQTRGSRRPFDDLPVGSDRDDAHVEAFEQRPAVHPRAHPSEKREAPSADRGRNGASNSCLQYVGTGWARRGSQVNEGPHLWRARHK